MHVKPLQKYHIPITKTYFEPYFAEFPREFKTRASLKEQLPNIIRMIKEIMTDMKQNEYYPDWENYEENPFILPSFIDSVVTEQLLNELPNIKTQDELLIDKHWDELPKLLPDEPKSFKLTETEDELNNFIKANKPSFNYKFHDKALWCSEPADNDKFKELFDSHVNQCKKNEENDNGPHMEYYLNNFTYICIIRLFP